jgi:cob(I)alamin adenosyltransferase
MAEHELQMLEPKERRGLVIVLTGNGKGKTTSALGMALRAAGHAMKVSIIHFMKCDMFSGEQKSVPKFGANIELHITGKGFCGIKEDSHRFEDHRSESQAAVALAKEKISSGKYDMVILDEINTAAKLGLIEVAQVLDLIQSKPALTHLVLTGRGAHPDVMDKADTVTEMQDVKHAYRQGIEPQPGVDY